MTLDLVFADVDGRPLNPATVSRAFDALVRSAGLPKLTLHGLRHTFATLALLDGIPSKVVAEVLDPGHRGHLLARHAGHEGRRHGPGRGTPAPAVDAR